MIAKSAIGSQMLFAANRSKSTSCQALDIISICCWESTGAIGNLGRKLISPWSPDQALDNNTTAIGNWPWESVRLPASLEPYRGKIPTRSWGSGDFAGDRTVSDGDIKRFNDEFFDFIRVDHLDITEFVDQELEVDKTCNQCASRKLSRSGWSLRQISKWYYQNFSHHDQDKRGRD